MADSQADVKLLLVDDLQENLVALEALVRGPGRQIFCSLSGVEALFNDLSVTGLGAALDGLFSSFSALATNPSDPTSRAAVLGAAEAFASRANAMGDALSDAKNELLKQAQDTAAQINERAASISQLNRRIQAAEAQGEDAADLKDQRNNLLLNLSELVDIRTIPDDKGSMIVQAAGSTLVEGVDFRPISIDLNAGTGRLEGRVQTIFVPGQRP